MCSFLSGYHTEKRGMRTHKWIDSHSDQIAFFGDKDLDATSGSSKSIKILFPAGPIRA